MIKHVNRQQRQADPQNDRDPDKSGFFMVDSRGSASNPPGPEMASKPILHKLHPHGKAYVAIGLFDAIFGPHCFVVQASFCSASTASRIPAFPDS